MHIREILPFEEVKVNNVDDLINIKSRSKVQSIAMAIDSNGDEFLPAHNLPPNMTEEMFDKVLLEFQKQVVMKKAQYDAEDSGDQWYINFIFYDQQF